MALGLKLSKRIWIAFGHFDCPAVYLRFLRWHFAIKRTRNEMFSERNGFDPVRRFAGWTLTIRRPETA